MVAPRIVVIGPPGSGKSTVAKALSRLWDVDMRDTDADVANAAGMSVSDIFLSEGEDAFRAREAQAVATALVEHSGVLALGGGAILDPATQRLLADYAAQGGTIAYLEVSLSAAAPRVGFNQSRPLLVGNPRQQWQQLMDARRDIYERLATVTVNTDSKSPKQVAHAIAEVEEPT